MECLVSQVSRAKQGSAHAAIVPRNQTIRPTSIQIIDPVVEERVYAIRPAVCGAARSRGDDDTIVLATLTLVCTILQILQHTFDASRIRATHYLHPLQHPFDARRTNLVERILDSRACAVEPPEASEGRCELLYLPIREVRVHARHSRQAGRAAHVADVDVPVNGAGVNRGHACGDDADDAVHEMLCEVDESEVLDMGAFGKDLVQQCHGPSRGSIGEVVLRVRAVGTYPQVLHNV